MDIQRVRLSQVSLDDLMELMNDPQVRRHLPLARGSFGPEECRSFVATKERMWKERGFGPWAFLHGDLLIGWGGVQPEGDEADLALVLSPRWWGTGRRLFHMIVSFAFEELGLDSVMVLLPPSRSRMGGLARLGFRPDGEATLAGERFLRFRLPRIPSP